jgi:gamma-carbonic anhydrase
MKFESVTERLKFFLAEKPVLDQSVYLAENATVLGKVTIGARSSVWFHSVIRADINEIAIGERTNLQDGSILHVADQFPLFVGDFVSCGHRAILHACTIGNGVLIGMGAVVMDGAIVGDGSIIGANTLVTKGSIIPPGSVVMGSPGKVVRAAKMEEQVAIRNLAEKYVAIAGYYQDFA